jgi:CheY-like chemotaxis protein
MKTAIAVSLLFLASVSGVSAQDPGWPRQITKQGDTLVYYQPQVDNWKDFEELDWRMAIAITPAGARKSFSFCPACTPWCLERPASCRGQASIRTSKEKIPSPSDSVSIGAGVFESTPRTCVVVLFDPPPSHSPSSCNGRGFVGQPPYHREADRKNEDAEDNHREYHRGRFSAPGTPYRIGSVATTPAARPRDIAVVVLDISMPVMTGLRSRASLRNEATRPGSFFSLSMRAPRSSRLVKPPGDSVT